MVGYDVAPGAPALCSNDCGKPAFGHHYIGNELTTLCVTCLFEQEEYELQEWDHDE